MNPYPKKTDRSGRPVPLVRGKCSVPTCYARQARCDETTLCTGHMADEEKYAVNHWRPNDRYTCTVDDCSNDSHRWELCEHHYRQALRRAFLNAVENPRKSRGRKIPPDYAAAPLPGNTHYKRPVPNSVLDTRQQQTKRANRYNDLPDI